MTLELQSKLQFTHRANIDKYKKILKTYLTDEERHFVEQRLAEEQTSLDDQLANRMPELNSTDVHSCARVDDMPTPNTHSFMSLCVQCGARIWVACSSPIEPKRMCVLCVVHADQIKN